MLRLYGFPSSNYYNVVKLVLLEKGLDFEEVPIYPPADESYLLKNPSGKFPCLETEEGNFLGESKVILNYLEEVYSGVRLLPEDPFARSRVRELMEIIDLYLEWPARRLYPAALENAEISDEIKQQVQNEMLYGVSILKQKAVFDPYICGKELGLVDFSAAIHLTQFSTISKIMFGYDFLDEISEVKKHREIMGERDSMKQVKQDRRIDIPKFQSHQKKLSGDET